MTTKDELEAALRERDRRIAELKAENDKWSGVQMRRLPFW
jgi:hypothetical protein